MVGRGSRRLLHPTLSSTMDDGSSPLMDFHMFVFLHASLFPFTRLSHLVNGHVLFIYTVSGSHTLFLCPLEIGQGHVLYKVFSKNLNIMQTLLSITWTDFQVISISEPFDVISFGVA